MQPKIICVTFKGKPCITKISCYSPTNVINITTFYNELSSLVWHIPTHYILIIGGDKNAQISKDENNNFCLHNSPNKNRELTSQVFFQE